MRQLKAEIYILVMLFLVCIVSFASDTTDEHFNRAREFLNTGKYMEAAEEFRAVVKLEPDGSKIGQNASYWVGQCYFRMGQFDEALSIFEEIIEDYPESSIVSVTQVMMDKVRREKESEKLRVKRNVALDKKVVIDPKTGLKYTKVFSDEKLNLLSHNRGLIISPDGRFLFDIVGHKVIPLKEGEEPFTLVPEIRETIYGSWSPDMSKFAFISHWSGVFFVVPVSPRTGRVTGDAKKIIEGIRDKSVEGGTYPNWSPDGKLLAFSWWKDGGFDIWTIPATGGEPTQITDDLRWERCPLWSHNGKSIIFSRKRELTTDNSGSWDVWRIPAQGGTPEKILENAVADKEISPDGTLLAFHPIGVGGVGILRFSDYRQFTMKPPEEVIGESPFYGPKKVIWSPQGKSLLFYNSGFEFWATLRIVSIYGGPSVELGKGVRFGAWTQRWSPDGKCIVTHDWETNDLWIVPTDGGVPEKLKVETKQKIWKYPFLPFSPNLKKLAFLTKDKSLWVGPISIEERRTIGKAVNIAKEINIKRQISIGWSPDSKWIAFSATKSGNADIWIASVDGRELKQLTDASEDETIVWSSGQSVWSPDGKMILYEKANALWMVSTSGGKPKEIVKEAFEPVWSPNGKEIAFLKSDYSFISTVSLANGEVRDIVALKANNMVNPEHPQCWRLTWSPDGKWLSFFTMRDEDHLWMVPSAGGEPVELASFDSDKWYQYWSPNSMKLSYNSDRQVRARIGAIWEVNVEELLSREEREQ